MTQPTNEQINVMAAEVLGIDCIDASLQFNGVCLKCGLHVFGHPNFCTDLNAAQRLVKHIFKTHIAENMKSNRFADVIFSALAIDAVSLNNNPNLSNRDLVALYRDADAKTITLAALVAAGKITIEDAKESI